MDAMERDVRYMSRAIELAKKGEGFVEPNPMVGCVIVKDDRIVGEGFHRVFGGNHAEIEALENAGPEAREATCYVTLEPCCHAGKKTPPCVPRLIEAGISRVVVAIRDPNPQVDGKGIEALRKAKISVECGVMDVEAASLCAPFINCVQKNRPWIHAKWAMTLDGKIASRTGSSQWITGEKSLAMVHRLRGRMDAIMIGARTALYDDPMLTARWEVILAGEQENNLAVDDFSPLSIEKRKLVIKEAIPRTPIRIVMDSTASLSPLSALAMTAKEVPVWVAVGPDAREVNIRRLEDAGCVIVELPGRIPNENDPERRAANKGIRNHSPAENEELLFVERRRFPRKMEVSVKEIYLRRIDFLMQKLVDHGVTNMILEGGETLIGSFFDARYIDEVHTFIAPKIIGGENAVSPVGGTGLADMATAYRLNEVAVTTCGQDVCIRGRVCYPVS